MFTVIFVTNSSKAVTSPDETNLLRLSLRGKGGIPFKCGGGICGTCRCRIESGIEHTDAVKDKERKHLSEADFASGHRMACQTFVRGDISVSWVPRATPVGTGARGATDNAAPSCAAAADLPPQTGS